VNECPAGDQRRAVHLGKRVLCRRGREHEGEKEEAEADAERRAEQAAEDEEEKSSQETPHQPALISIRGRQTPHGEFDPAVRKLAPAFDLCHVRRFRIAIEHAARLLARRVALEHKGFPHKTIPDFLAARCGAARGEPMRDVRRSAGTLHDS
jgi:hypothetical protein